MLHQRLLTIARRRVGVRSASTAAIMAEKGDLRRLVMTRDPRCTAPVVLTTLIVILALTTGCSDEVQQTIFTSLESGLKTIADGLISALFVALAGNRGAF